MAECPTCQLDYWTAPHCPDCHHTWSGTGNYNHCVRCHETFQSESSADKHELYDRTANNSEGEMFCCSPEDRGLVWKPDVGSGVWGWPKDEGMVARMKAREPSARQPRVKKQM